ncbi:endoribonuclease Dicer homolog 2-like [Mangifera indica]|uniref:endoribonuclease Dicer homolog 2-like n=1 Tax=Mangifera indica TaxID=29780 RepID=UPI001CFABA29|nr:endoribonuclease Dicer homolog 2-like [Mangifera indica]XP_044480295.1 endoribonuclease Dicer homolog 2-like [Mangifera indica]
MDMVTTEQGSSDPLPFARCYQLEALEKAIKQNTIVFLETGSGKTLIAIMLLRHYAYLLRKPSQYIAVFLVPQVVLVSQQAEAIKLHTDLKVGMYWGEMGVDYWDSVTWNEEIGKHEVIVMTPQILLNGLRHSFLKLNMIKVLILDECHHTRGKYPYACIMTEFYHPLLKSGESDLPRIFGMTASPIKSKGANSNHGYWENIDELETLMNSKVYTCRSESVIAQYIPFSTPKFKIYKYIEFPYALYARLEDELNSLLSKHEISLNNLDLIDTKAESIRKKVLKIHSTLLFCVKELGVWLASKAAQSLSRYENDFFAWGHLDVLGGSIVKRFSSDAHKVFATVIPSGPGWSIGNNVKVNVDAGLLTEKVACLFDSLLEYRALQDIRCIIFVQRVITAIVLEPLLNELLPQYCSWKTKYIAGNNSGLQCQSKKKQNEIVEEFRQGLVNIIIATSILEEGLDVQSCNLVIRFDPSATVCSFIQSRGRARMQNSDYLLMVKSGDHTTRSRLENYLASGEIMRKESLHHASHLCSHLGNGKHDEDYYCVESTGAIVTLSSSVGLIHFYCSRLPSDGYFKPSPRFVIDKEMEICTLYLPKSCPIQIVQVRGNVKTLKQTACLKACKQLHQIGELTGNLVPEMVVEEAEAQKSENDPYNDKQPIYFPPELVNEQAYIAKTMYQCYLIELKQNFNYDVPLHDIILAMRTELEDDILNVNFDMEVDRGTLTVSLKYVGFIELTREQVLNCRRFQITIFRVLLDHNVKKLAKILDGFQLGKSPEADYLLLPSTNSHQPLIDWTSVASVLFPCNYGPKDHTNCPSEGNAHFVETKSGRFCVCMIRNSLVYTPHNGYIYCITGILDHLNANSLLTMKDGAVITYKEYYKQKHGVHLCFNEAILLNGRHLFTVKNYLNNNRNKERDPSHLTVELPPELCKVIMSPISWSTFYSFNFVPSIMHRFQSLLLAINLKKMLLDDCVQNVTIPTMKVLEAITTKKCVESFHLESLETLGDSFLKYAASNYLFIKHQNNHEGLLSVKKDRIISNASLCKLGCDHKIPGFIRTEPFDPKSWIIPGDNSGSYSLQEELLSDARKIYVSSKKTVKGKTIADAVEALIGAFISTAGESAGILFLSRIGIDVDFVNRPYQRHFQIRAEKLINRAHLESLLNYKFHDSSLLVEALTHGSYMLPEIPSCYQRLEFLGDAVLDYIITIHLYNKYPGMRPGLITDMRSASVNNDCYAQSSVKHGLHKHILHCSHELHKQIHATVESFEKSPLGSTFGWESESSFPKVLGDVIESLAGAIYIDSGYDKEKVFESVRPLLEPLVTPETVRLQPARELNELCQKQHFDLKKLIHTGINVVATVTVEVEANGRVFKYTSTADDKKTSKKLACKEVLKSLKENISIM